MGNKRRLPVDSRSRLLERWLVTLSLGRWISVAVANRLLGRHRVFNTLAISGKLSPPSLPHVTVIGSFDWILATSERGRAGPVGSFVLIVSASVARRINLILVVFLGERRVRRASLIPVLFKPVVDGGRRCHQARCAEAVLRRLTIHTERRSDVGRRVSSGHCKFRH